MSQTERKLSLSGREIILLGTAHISHESINQVVETIRAEKPDCVAIELDEDRLSSMKNPDAWQKLDIIKVLKNGQGFLMMANIVLASFQRKMGADIGVKPGEEMRAAIDTAADMQIPAVMVDRPIKTTLRRAWAKNTFFGKCKLLAALIASAFDREEISSDQIEKMKTTNEMDSMMAELSDYLPKVKEVLIDERDRYLASHIWTAAGNKVIAVLGAGHLNGVESILGKLAAGDISADTADIAQVPRKKTLSKIIGWGIPVLIIALIAVGFYFGGREKGSRMVGSWFFWNALLAAVGTAAAGGHPLAILAGAIGAPFTSLCPVVGAGMVTGLVQAVMCKPKVCDMESLQTDVLSVKGVYKNRILRVLMVFILSSLGSSVGTFIAGASYLDVVGQLCARAWSAVTGIFR